MFEVKSLEVAVVGLMKINHQGHDFTGTHNTLAPTSTFAATQLLALPLGRKPLAKIIHLTKQFRQIRFCYTHFQVPLEGYLCNRTVPQFGLSGYPLPIRLSRTDVNQIFCQGPYSAVALGLLAEILEKPF